MQTFFLNANGQTDGQKDGRTDRHTDRQTDRPSFNKRLDIFVLYSSVQDRFIHKAIYPVFTLFPLKITSDPRPLIILNLHGKCKNQKSKNMGTWKNHLPRCPCFSKCKFFCIFPDSKLSMGTMFFFKNLKIQHTPLKKFKNVIFVANKIATPAKVALLNMKF